MVAGLSIALAQSNPTVGDISGNVAKLRRLRAAAAEAGADLLVTSELYLCAYPPEDLILKPSFLDSLKMAVDRFAQETADGGPAVLLGLPWRENGRIYNAMLLLDGGVIAAKTFKYDLPNYGPFDEKRIFASGPLPTPLNFKGHKLGILVCEDMWTAGPSRHLSEQGADILIVSNGSPFEIGKDKTRQDLAASRAKETHLPLLYVNQVGGQDELVFDGASFALDKEGKAIAFGSSWKEDLLIIQLDSRRISSNIKREAPPPDELKNIYQALVVGLKDYVDKNGFPGVVLGMSGGIDSALAAAIAVDALGPDKVWGVMLPSPFTSTESTSDARRLAKLSGYKLDAIPIKKAMKAFELSLTPLLEDKVQGIVSENIQSRCRGLILMALSNATGHMVLSTGNKSEMSVGYATLYGDMCGGFAVLKDVYKTQVYHLSRWRNGHRLEEFLGAKGRVIPDRVLTKAPTAELRPGQTDQETLPPYDVLDGILECLIEHDLGMTDIVAKGFDPVVVAKIWSLLDKAEYKRRQAPPGVKITLRNLSRDRRYPITNKYKERAASR